LIISIAAGILASGSQLRAGQDDRIAYPVGYREWTHVKSALVGPQSPIFSRYGGIHHIYANQNAMEGYRTGSFPDGSVIVFDLLETSENAGVTSEGPRKFIDVMVKDGKWAAETGGWAYEEFRGDSETERSLSGEGRAACNQCHLKQKNRGCVSSTFRK